MTLPVIATKIKSLESIFTEVNGVKKNKNKKKQQLVNELVLVSVKKSSLGSQEQVNTTVLPLTDTGRDTHFVFSPRFAWHVFFLIYASMNCVNEQSKSINKASDRSGTVMQAHQNKTNKRKESSDDISG